MIKLKIFFWKCSNGSTIAFLWGNIFDLKICIGFFPAQNNAILISRNAGGSNCRKRYHFDVEIEKLYVNIGRGFTKVIIFKSK